MLFSHGERQRDRETEHKRLHFQICLFVYGNFLREALFVAVVVASRNYERFYCFIFPILLISCKHSLVVGDCFWRETDREKEKQRDRDKALAFSDLFVCIRMSPRKLFCFDFDFSGAFL
jgi:hypothetical protein